MAPELIYAASCSALMPSNTLRISADGDAQKVRYVFRKGSQISRDFGLSLGWGPHGGHEMGGCRNRRRAQTSARRLRGFTDSDELIAKAQAKAPAHRLVSIDDVGVAVAFAMDGAN
jgi:hypothetical protein